VCVCVCVCVCVGIPAGEQQRLLFAEAMLLLKQRHLRA
jgi:hypothetical protein